MKWDSWIHVSKVSDFVVKMNCRKSWFSPKIKYLRGENYNL